MRPKVQTVENRAARIAAEAHGVVTREELLIAGVTPGQIKRRVRSGALIPEYPGVYRVGHAAPSTEARYTAAVKACGHSALLSGRPGAHLLGLTRGAPPSPEVTTPKQRIVRGLRTHHSRGLCAADGMTWRRIPVTTVARTLVDLAAVLLLDDLARACHEAGVKHKTTPAQVKAVVRRRPTSPGAGKLRLIMEGDAPVTLSRLESEFLRVLRHAGLPQPETNRRASGKRVDCRWPEHRLTVELDSYRFHNSRHAWEQDRRRERQARARGDEFRRYTWGDVFEVRDMMLNELVDLLPCELPF